MWKMSVNLVDYIHKILSANTFSSSFQVDFQIRKIDLLMQKLLKTRYIYIYNNILHIHWHSINFLCQKSRQFVLLLLLKAQTKRYDTSKLKRINSTYNWMKCRYIPNRIESRYRHQYTFNNFSASTHHQYKNHIIPHVQNFIVECMPNRECFWNNFWKWYANKHSNKKL